MKHRTFVSFEWPSEPVDEREEEGELMPPGRSIMEHVRNRLAAKGIAVGQIDQHDSYGWGMEINHDNATIYSMLQYSDPWLITTEPHQSFWQKLVRRDSAATAFPVCSAIHESLTETSEARSIQWFSRSEFHAKKGVGGAPSPGAA